MKPLHEQCTELALDWVYDKEGRSKTQIAGNKMADLLRHLSTVLRHEGLTDERREEIHRNWCTSPLVVASDLMLAVEQETAAPLLAEIAQLKEQLHDQRNPLHPVRLEQASAEGLPAPRHGHDRPVYLDPLVVPPPSTDVMCRTIWGTCHRGKFNPKEHVAYHLLADTPQHLKDRASDMLRAGGWR